MNGYTGQPNNPGLFTNWITGNDLVNRNLSEHPFGHIPPDAGPYISYPKPPQNFPIPPNLINLFPGLFGPVQRPGMGRPGTGGMLSTGGLMRNSGYADLMRRLLPSFRNQQGGGGMQTNTLENMNVGSARGGPYRPRF